MKVKLDENLPESLVEIFAQPKAFGVGEPCEHGHQAMTVSQEGLAGLADEPLFEAEGCEERSNHKGRRTAVYNA